MFLRAATTLRKIDKLNLADNGLSQQCLSEVVDVLVSPQSADMKELNLSGNSIFGDVGEVPLFCEKWVIKISLRVSSMSVRN